MIAVVDYDAAHSASIAGELRSLGAHCQPTRAREALSRAHKIVLPDAPDVARAARTVRDAGLVDVLLKAADDGRWILGVSRGLQLLLDVIHDGGQHTGLGLVTGKVIPFDPGIHPAARHFPPVHQGWNQVHFAGECPLMRDVASGSFFYFDHGGHVEPLDDHVVVGQSNHGRDFCSILWQDNVLGTQFLPDRSDDAGRRVLENFMRL